MVNPKSCQTALVCILAMLLVQYLYNVECGGMHADIWY